MICSLNSFHSLYDLGFAQYPWMRLSTYHRFTVNISFAITFAIAITRIYPRLHRVFTFIAPSNSTHPYTSYRHQTLIGHKYKPFVLPTSLSVDQFNTLQHCAASHQQTGVLPKYYLIDTNANDKHRYRLIELREQFAQLRNASTSIKSHLSTGQLSQSTAHSPSKHASIKVNIDLLQFCLDLEQLLKLMQCSTCKHPQLSLRSALYLQLKHAILINQQESDRLSDRILACVRRFEGEHLLTRKLQKLSFCWKSLIWKFQLECFN